MINDYKNWYASKQEFIHHLKHHDSIIMNRVWNVFVTLNYITTLKEEELNEDYDVIFDCGYSYIYSIVGEMELYLSKYFNDNMHQFLNYELLLNYSLYLNELKGTLIENEDFNEDANEEFNKIIDEIESIVKNKQPYTDAKIDEYDNRILATFVPKKEHITTPEVFDRIAEELQII